MFTNIYSHFSQVQKNFISTDIFPFSSKVNNKIVVVALAIIAAFATLFVIFRCFIDYKMNLSPTPPVSNVLQKKGKIGAPKTKHSDKAKKVRKPVPLSPKSQDLNLNKETHPALSDKESNLALASEFDEEDDIEFAIKLQEESDKVLSKDTKPNIPKRTPSNNMEIHQTDSLLNDDDLLSDEQYALSLAQQFAKEDGINFESILQLQKKI